MLQMILDKALDKWALQGFSLKEEADDFLVLYHEGCGEILRLNQTSPRNTPAFLQCECEAHLTLKHGDFGGGIEYGGAK
jgi:hypothetical protein